MNDELDRAGTALREVAPPSNKSRRSTPDPRPLPGLSVRELYAERNWPALAGLALIGIGLLYVAQDIFGLAVNLWALALLGIGGWLVLDAHQRHADEGEAWGQTARHRLMAGALAILIGVLGMLRVDWWGLLLLGAGGWLGYDTWRKHAAGGRGWTRRARNRLVVAGILGAAGLVSLLNLGSAWPFLLIVLGAAMLYGRTRRS